MNITNDDKVNLDFIKSIYTKDKKEKKCINREENLSIDMINRIIIQKENICGQIGTELNAVSTKQQ